MFTKCFFLLQKCFFVCEMGAFFAKNVLFFPLKGAFFKCFVLPKSTTIPDCTCEESFSNLLTITYNWQCDRLHLEKLLNMEIDSAPLVATRFTMIPVDMPSTTCRSNKPKI